MKLLFLGALLGLLLTTPQGLHLTTATVTALASQPLLVAFVLGAVARPYLPLVRRWTR
ncbi:hypothetical protein [Streptomyces sp. I4(2020)]|uniref:hypothetical protein n=1 Tax=Streptomyces sp. I4(2020) TaxID=2760981 RepID=UPI0018EE7F6F|nr:hypothetical protein [Streptomyces sp. I4(2020)]MBJ6615543.1 hypothetical protein [Streptomyces sp. I3(2020)]MBJ6626040.1 hypothetical protein [Streptomyces sp. I4(2020)]